MPCDPWLVTDASIDVRTLANPLEAQLRSGAEDLALTLREGLVPLELPTVVGLDIEARCHVAHREEVGGDFYDVVDSEDGCSIAVGDVCGKATKVASLTGTALWALRALTLGSSSPASTMQRLNRLLLDAVDGHASMDDSRLQRLLSEHAGGTAPEVAARLEAQLSNAERPDGALRDDAAFFVLRVA